TSHPSTAKPTLPASTTSSQSASPSPTTVNGLCMRYHTVAPGDTCEAIATKRGIYFGLLSALNPTLTEACTISPGQLLCIAISTTQAIPNPTTSPVPPSPSPTLPSVTCTKTYKVLPIDTCETILQKNGIYFAYLKSLNPGMTEGCSLAAGQDMCVSGTGVKECGMVYQLKDGEYCWAAANSNGITIDFLYELNPFLLKDCSNLRPKDTLCVARPAGTPTSTTSATSTPTARPGCRVSHLIKSGENCGVLASSQKLLSYNPHVNAKCSNIYLNDWLCI
ncbi:hypothetical protein BC829DRAFT_350868, partial [Chytridium lagenaria]